MKTWETTSSSLIDSEKQLPTTADNNEQDSSML